MKSHVMDIPITPFQYRDFLTRSSMGEHIQNIFPNLSAEHREFLISGITPEEWAAEFPPEEDEDLPITETEEIDPAMELISANWEVKGYLKDEQCPALNWEEEMKEYRQQLGLPAIDDDTEIIPATSDEDIRDDVTKEWDRDFDHEDPYIYD
jgi:hypothetical protein